MLDFRAQRSRLFWKQLDPSLQLDDFPMTVLTGTTAEIGALVYERPVDEGGCTLQRDKFKTLWLDY